MVKLKKDEEPANNCFNNVIRISIGAGTAYESENLGFETGEKCFSRAVQPKRNHKSPALNAT